MIFEDCLLHFQRMNLKQAVSIVASIVFLASPVWAFNPSISISTDTIVATSTYSASDVTDAIVFYGQHIQNIKDYQTREQADRNAYWDGVIKPFQDILDFFLKYKETHP